ncbi:Abi family protein [bacterium]|nr:Abi family protein [bacterium]
MLEIQKQLKQFESTISMERLESFLQGEKTNLETILCAYKNNIIISQALYPELSILEITLRNAINTMLCTYISPNWIENEIQNKNILFDYDFSLLNKAYCDAQKESKNKQFKIGKVVANLNFGFWTNLCSKKYNSLLWTKKGCFKAVFINYPPEKKQQIHEISTNLCSIRKLRNRIFHYEPIFKNPKMLLNKYNQILEILSYLPQDNANLLRDTSTFIKTYNLVTKKPEALYEKS